MNAEQLRELAREELRRPPDCTKTRLLARAVLVRARRGDRGNRGRPLMYGVEDHNQERQCATDN